MIQLQFLNKLLDTRDSSLITLNNLTEDFFSDYIGEFRFIKAHLQEYGNIPDKATFLNSFPDFNLIEVNESSKYLIDFLFEDKNKRFLASTLNKMRECLINNDTEKAMDIYSKSFDNVIKAKHLDSVDIFEDTSRYERFIEKTTDFAKHYVKTGLPELDEVIGGWDRKEELATIVARPGVGKSWILLKTALTAAMEGLKVGIYSGEMSEDKVGFRADTLLSHISNTKILHGNESIVVEYKKYLENIKDKIKGSVKVITPNMISGMAGVQSLRAFVEKENLDMLCIDQYSLLEDDRKGKSQSEQISNIAKDLKALQVLKQIPIITVSQQNRESTENGVTTANVALSDKVSQYSTILLFLDQKDSILTVYLGKARDSVTGKTLKYSVNLDKGLFNFIPEEKDATEGSHCESLKDEYEIDNDINEEQPF